eukprot:jgi/Chrzof1/1916/Cz10g26060.t1
MAARLLLAVADGHEGHDHALHDHGHEEHVDGDVDAGLAENTLPLRIAALFVIFAAALLLGLPPIFLKHFQSPDAVFARLARGFAGGVILALALVHIIPEAVEELHGLLDYHIGGIPMLFGIILLVLIDSSMTAWFVSRASKERLQHNGAHSKSETEHTNELDTGKAAAVGSVTHVHQCLRSMNAETWLSTVSKPVVNVRQYVTAYTMELGCIFHSVIIGVGVGTITGSQQLVVTLMIAIAFHQALEGLALGSVLALCDFSKLKKVAMLVLYSITAPLGIAVGIAITSSYDPGSEVSRAVQGTLNGVSGGMLLYIAMYQLIAEEFSREDLLVKPKLRLGMYASLLLGAACMCILGIWA